MKTESTGKRKDVNLQNGHAHTKRMGSPRRCSNPQCPVAFTMTNPCHECGEYRMDKQ